jgi:FAD synthase
MQKIKHFLENQYYHTNMAAFLVKIANFLFGKNISQTIQRAMF